MNLNQPQPGQRMDTSEMRVDDPRPDDPPAVGIPLMASDATLLDLFAAAAMTRIGAAYVDLPEKVGERIFDLAESAVAESVKRQPMRKATPQDTGPR